MESFLRWIGGRSRPARAAAVAALACSVGACGSIVNMMPDAGNFRLPDRSTFLPTSNRFSYQMSHTTPVGPADLVNGQGQCAAAPGGADAAPHGVSLDMTECEVVRNLGQPQSVGFTSQGTGDQRRVVLTYTTGDRPGIYEFAGGRLTAIEQGNEPPPAVAKKPPSKKSKQQPPA
jgi:hypothetical protein